MRRLMCLTLLGLVLPAFLGCDSNPDGPKVPTGGGNPGAPAVQPAAGVMPRKGAPAKRTPPTNAPTDAT